MNAMPLLIVIFAAATVTACASGRAATVRREPLVVPPPPPRVIAPAPVAEQPVERVVSEPEPVPPLPRASKTTPARPDPKPAEPPPQPDATAPPPSSPAAGAANGTTTPSELRTPETPDDGRATKQVRDTIGRASGTLGRVDYRNLSQPARLQYDMAKRFIEQAEEALKVRNYTAAQLMAEKAETIAKELAGR